MTVLYMLDCLVYAELTVLYVLDCLKRAEGRTLKASILASAIDRVCRVLTASERRRNNLKRFKDFPLKMAQVKARIWLSTFLCLVPPPPKRHGRNLALTVLSVLI